ncbi:MAG TPA: hypothetical protein VKQ71_05610 [Acidimicrobiales bacterium]|nr:hypothetical protein [Acidimicrobiales bacterium]
MAHIELGHSLITFVEPHRERLAEYNRWYEHDHAYAAMTSAPGCFAYRRFVATRPLKELRYPDPSAVAQPVDKGSYLSLFWFERDRVGEVLDYTAAISPALAAAGRMSTDRDHVSTAVYDYLGWTGRGGSPVPPEIALDHPWAGMVAAWLRPDPDVSVVDLAAWARSELDGDLVAGKGPVGQVLDFTQSDFDRMALTGRVDEVVRCYFLDADPREVWEDVFAGLGKTVEAGGRGRVELVAPFIPTIPGTDRYQDELW